MLDLSPKIFFSILRFGGDWHGKRSRTVNASSVGKAVRLPSATAAVHVTIALRGWRRGGCFYRSHPLKSMVMAPNGAIYTNVLCEVVISRAIFEGVCCDRVRHLPYHHSSPRGVQAKSVFEHRCKAKTSHERR